MQHLLSWVLDCGALTLSLEQIIPKPLIANPWVRNGLHRRAKPVDSIEFLSQWIPWVGRFINLLILAD